MIDVKKIAKLARLQISADEERLYAEQLMSVVEHFNDLKEVDTDGIEPFISPVENTRSWRKDEVISELDQDAALSAAPELMGKLFRVPPVV